MRVTYLTLLLISAGLGACASEPGPDTTGPDSDRLTPPAAAVRCAIPADGRRLPARATPPTPGVTWRDPGVGLAAVTTVCDAGFLDPDGSPEGGLSGGTYDAIEVPPGAICVLDNVTVTNSVRAFAGSRLFIQGSEIGGHVRGLDASAVQISGGTHVVGNVNVQGGHDAFFASCAVDDATIDGNLVCADNDPGSPIIRTEQGPVTVGGSVRLVNNVIPAGFVMLMLNAEVAGDADVRRNSGGGFKSVQGNTIIGVLTCRKNDAPFTGAPNTAGGFAGQC